MKHIFNAYLLSGICAFSFCAPLHAIPSKKIKKHVSSYIDGLKAFTQTSLAHPLSALNIGAKEPDSDRSPRTGLYQRTVHSVRSTIATFRNNILRARAYLRSNEGKRVVYETGLFSILMAGGYKLWMQNQQTQQRQVALQEQLQASDSSAKQRSADAKQRSDEMTNAITALDTKFKRKIGRVRDDVATEMQRAIAAFQTLATEVRRPNRAAATASALQQGVAGRWQKMWDWKANWDAQIEKEDQEFEQELAADDGFDGDDGSGDDDSESDGDGSGASADAQEDDGGRRRVWEPEGAARMREPWYHG